MKNFNFLSSLGRQSSGLGIATLASTVGSPSAHRRGAMLKLISVLVLVLTLGVGQMWGTETTIASWGKISISANTAYKASDGDADNKNVAQFTSNKAMTTAGTNCYYGSSAGGAVITFSNLDLSNYTGITMTFYARASQQGTMQIEYSANGSSYTNLNAPSLTKNEAQKTSNEIPNTAKYIKLTHSASSGSFYFGTVVIKGTYSGGGSVTELDVPTGMSSGTPGMNGATLSWNAVTNASGYSLTIGSNSPITSGFTTSAGVVSYNLTGLDAETTYTWKVKAVGDGTNYSNSEDCATQNFTTAADPTQKVLTFNLASNNLSLPTAKSSSAAGNYTYTLNEVNYTFSATDYQGNSDGGIYFSTNYTMMYKQNALGLPAISDYKLVKVVASNSSGCSTSAVVSITSNTTGTAISGGTGQTWSSTSSNYTYNLTGTDYNTVYYVYVSSAANAQITQLKLTYKPKPSVSSISIKTAPTKTTYTANEYFDPSGLVITVNYSDNTSEDVAYGNTTASDFSFSPTISTALNATHTAVTVTYGTKTANQAITVNRIATTLAWSAASYTANIGATYTFPTLTKTPAALEGVTFTSSNTDVVETISAAGVPTVKGTGTTTITAAFGQTDVYAAATSATYTLTINSASSPTLEVDPTSVTFALTAVGGNRTEVVTLAGEHLDANATYEITGDDKAMFSIVDPTFPLTPEGGELLEDITIKYAPTAAAANHTATLTITSGVASATVTLSGSAKNRRTVTWYKADDTELTAQERGSATTEVWDGDAVTVLPAAPASCDASISFQGWTNATYAKSDDAPTVLFDDSEDAPAISGGNASYYAVWANASGEGGSVEITRTTTNFPTGYGTANTFTEYTLNDYKFMIQQVFNNSNATGTGAQTMQWRASGNSNGTGTIYNKDVFPGHISSIVIVYASDDSNKNIALKIGDAENPTSGTAITPSVSNTYTYTFDCSAYSYDYFVLTNGSGAGYVSSITINYAASIKDYSTVCSVPVEITDPTFSPAAGSYDEDQNVAISAAQGMTIYYSIGAESNPKTAGTAYTGTISVTEDKVIKAIATDGNGNWSNIVTKTYTINYSPSIAAYIAKAQATTRYLRLSAAQNCVVTAVKKNNQDKVTNIYCQDNSGAGIIIYNGSGFGSNEINVGDRIVGAVSGTYSPYLKQPEMESAAFADGVTFTAVSRPDAPTVTVANVNSGAAYTANPMMLVTVADLYYKSVSGSTYTFNTQANGEGTDITIYDNFSYLSGKTMPGVACTIVGIMARNNDNYQVLPVELTTAATAAMPTISPTGGADAENAVEVIYLSEISVGSVADEDITITLNDVEKTDDNPILVQGDLKLEVSAKRDFYADNSVTYYYKPSAYPKNISVTSEHGTVVVKVGDNVVETALPGATVTFTVTPENEHFHIASTSVTYEGGSLTPSLSENVYSFTMPDKDATIVVNYTEDTKYSITFNGGGAAGEGPAAIEDQYAGAEITLPTKEEANYTAPTDKVFNGWLVTSGEDVVEQSAGMFVMPAGNVTITAQWASKVYCALTLSINGATTTTNIDREVKYVLPTEEDAISGYDFYGWAIAPEVDDVEEAIDTIKSFTPAANEASKTLYAVFKREYVGEDKEDELTAADLAATGTSYADFSNVQKVSNAKYAGNSAKNNAGAIQLRSDKSTAGIVSTVSGGTIKSVKITVASGSNTIDVYGSNTAYAAASDLYGSSKGTKIGSTSSTGTITPTAQQVFKYVGIRSNSGAAYLSSVTITWTPKATYYTTAPAQVYDVEYALGGGAWKENEGCEAAKVKAGQTYTICADEPVRDHYTFAKWQIGGEDASGEITINANTTITAVWTAKVESNVTYNAGTGSGDPVVISTVEEGTEVTLKAIGSGEGQANFAKSGYDFVGWLRGNVLYKAGETFEMPAEAVTLIAQWKKQNIEKLSLVTDASQLLDGMEIVLACKNPVSNNTEKDPAIAGVLLENKYLKSVTTNVTFNNDNTVSYSSEDVITLTLESESEGWALRNGTNYLTPNGKNNQVKWGTSPFVWSISIANGNAYIQQGNYTINYNAAQGTERFSQYTNQQNDIQIYGKATVVSGTTSISQIGYVDGDVIVLSESATLTVDADIAPTTVIVPAGGTVTVKDNKTIDANTVIVENGGTLDIQTNGTVKTNETLIIHSTLGKGTGTTASGNAPGACGQVVNGGNITVSGDVYLEIDLTQDAKASAGWYAFSVPFPVDAMNGVYYKETKLTNEVGYAIMSHDGALRAKDEYAWKKFRGIMQPGVFYVITVGNTDYKTLRFKKVTGEALVASTSVAVSPFPSQTGDNADGAWNGIGNPNLQISNLSTSVTTMQFYDHKTNSFIGRDHSVNLVVGSAFFIQYNTTSSVSIPTEINDGHGYLAPKREQKDIENTIYKVELMNMTTDELEDNVFLTAREDALNEYEIGRDVAKLSMGTAKCAQMYVPAYGTQLCAADFRLINDKAEYPLTLTAPAAGTYSITAPNAENADLYLTYEGAIIWNLSESAYEFDLNKGTTNGYGLLLQKKAPAVVTGVETVTGYGLQVTGVQKIVIDDHVFILRGGQMYDVNGKMVK